LRFERYGRASKLLDFAGASAGFVQTDRRGDLLESIRTRGGVESVLRCSASWEVPDHPEIAIVESRATTGVMYRESIGAFLERVLTGRLRCPRFRVA
jgi:hypothetical protein